VGYTERHERHAVSEVLPGVVTSGRKALKAARLAAADGRGSGSGDLGTSASHEKGRKGAHGDDVEQAVGGWQQQHQQQGVEQDEGGEEGGVQHRRKRSKKLKPEVDNAMADAAADALLALNSG
jgi:ABC-type branched-subunit amino acid transport system substrate-binding protein